MGDFEEVERLQAGLADWLSAAGPGGPAALRDADPAVLLPALCAAAFGPGLAGADPAGFGVLAAVRADALARVLREAAGRAQLEDSSEQPLRQEIRDGIAAVLAAGGPEGEALWSDIAMVMREIDAGGTALRTAIETGDGELTRAVLVAVEAVSREFGDMAFMLADLGRAARAIQDSLDTRESDLRLAREQAARQSADVRLIREELTVIEQRAGQWAEQAPGPGPRWTGDAPYRGLLSYDRGHEGVFLGRARLTAELAGKLAGTPIVMVTGAAGAGKTSLLQAGLIPALARGVQVPGSVTWPVVSIRATTRPLTALAAGLATLDGGDPAVIGKTLASAPGEAHLLIRDIIAAQTAAGHQAFGDLPPLILIIDQFEEIFADTSAGGRREREAFLDAVHSAGTGLPSASRPSTGQPSTGQPGTGQPSTGQPSTRVVIAVRGDYWDRCGACPQLTTAMAQQLVVGPLDDDGLRRAVTGPAQASGLALDPGLLDDVIADVHTAAGAPGPGVLPHLSQALLATWQRRDGGRLTQAGYAATGGISGAVEASAEAIYQDLPGPRQNAAREVFRQLTATGPGQQPVRRAVAPAALRAQHPSDVQAVLTAFAQGHLLEVSEDRAEIAHDTLLQAWPRLRAWLEEDQASLILHGRLATDTEHWREHGEDPALLYHGVQLAAASEAARMWAGQPDRYPALGPGTDDFLRASGRAATRGRWWRRVLSAVLVLAVLAVLAGAGLAVRSARNTASRDRTTDLSVRLAAQSTTLDAANPVMAALLAGAAWSINQTAPAQYSLLQALAQPVRGILAGPPATVTAVAYSPDGKRLAVGYRNGAIQLWDLATHQLMASTTWGAAPMALAFGGGGRTLEVADPSAIATWDLISRAAISARPLNGSTSGDAVAFSPGGKTVATGSTDGNVRLWDVATQTEIGAPMSSGLRGVEAVAFSLAGTTVAAASSDGTIQLWDVATRAEDGSTMAASSAAVRALAFSPDGKFLAAGGTDGGVRLWDFATQAQQGATMTGGGSVAALAFSANGATIASTDGSGSVKLWSFATHKQTGNALTAPAAGAMTALAFAPGSSQPGTGQPSTGQLITGQGDGSIRLWDPATFHQVSAPTSTAGPDPSTASPGSPPAVLSTDGTTLAVNEGQGRIGVWNTTTGQADGRPFTSQHAVTGFALSPDGTTLAVAAGDSLRLWNTATGQAVGPALPASGPVAFSPDGTLVAAVSPDGSVQLWNAVSQQAQGHPMPGGRPQALAFSPNGHFLAIVNANGTAQLWMVSGPKRAAALTSVSASAGTAAAGQSVAVAFSPDGSTLATASGGVIRLWNIATGQENGAPMTAGSGPVYGLAFGPGGTILASAGGDGTARLWDVATQQQIGAAMTAGSASLYAVAFSDKGTVMTTAGADGNTRRWDVAFPSSLPAGACAITAQSLTRAQWADYAGIQPFQQFCPAS